MKNSSHVIFIGSFMLLAASVMLTGCSSSPTSEERTLLVNDEIMQGPGIFSGKKGVFYLVGGNNRVSEKRISYQSDSEIEQKINEKIKQLDKDKAELEEMKKKIKSR